MRLPIYANAATTSSKVDLCRLVLVSKMLYTLVIPDLYQSVSLNSSVAAMSFCRAVQNSDLGLLVRSFQIHIGGQLGDDLHTLGGLLKEATMLMTQVIAYQVRHSEIGPLLLNDIVPRVECLELHMPIIWNPVDLIGVKGCMPSLTHLTDLTLVDWSQPTDNIPQEYKEFIARLLAGVSQQLISISITSDCISRILTKVKGGLPKLTTLKADSLILSPIFLNLVPSVRELVITTDIETSVDIPPCSLRELESYSGPHRYLVQIISANRPLKKVKLDADTYRITDRGSWYRQGYAWDDIITALQFNEDVEIRDIVLCPISIDIRRIPELSYLRKLERLKIIPTYTLDLCNVCAALAVITNLFAKVLTKRCNTLRTWARNCFNFYPCLFFSLCATSRDGASFKKPRYRENCSKLS